MTLWFYTVTGTAKPPSNYLLGHHGIEDNKKTDEYGVVGSTLDHDL